MAFINVTASNNKGIIKDIDRNNFMHLGKTSTARLDLYNFALALGFRQGYPTEMSEKKESFVREEYVEKNNCRYIYSSLYYSEHINRGNKDDLDKIVKTENTFALADEYANTGFSVLKDAYNSKSDEKFMLELFKETDEMYKQCANDLDKRED